MQAGIKIIIYCFYLFVCLKPFGASAQNFEQRTLLLDFNQLYDTSDMHRPYNDRTVFTHNEVKAEAQTPYGFKQITILNIYVPRTYGTYGKKSEGVERVVNELKTFYLFPKAGQDTIQWQPVMATDSIVKTALNKADFLNSIGIKGGIRGYKYHITAIILKKANKYYYYDSNIIRIGGSDDFNGRVTYYPTESEAYNCRARVFTRQQIADEMKRIKEFVHLNSDGFDSDKRGLAKKFHIAYRDSITHICHFEQYYDLHGDHTEFYYGYCNKIDYPADFRYFHFTQIDVHPIMGTLGVFLLCDTDDLIKTERDRLGSLYYRFKSIGGYDTVDKYIEALNKNITTKYYKFER